MMELLLTVAGQVDAYIHGEKVVTFALAAVLGRELLRRDCHQLGLLADLYILVVVHSRKIFSALDILSVRRFEMSTF